MNKRPKLATVAKKCRDFIARLIVLLIAKNEFLSLKIAKKNNSLLSQL